MDKETLEKLMSKEDFAKLLTESGMDIYAQQILGRDATTPVTLASLETEKWLRDFITQDPACGVMKDLVRRWSNVEDPVLITGQTGTGKELIAKALHGRRDGKFVAINCAGFVANESLMESELFGHKKGSFTGASENYGGLVRAAHNGTLFLDEIGELPIMVQAKLLRVIQEKVVRPVGSTDTVPVSFKLVSATHENIETLVEEKKFRMDLYYRISTGRITIPALSERLADVELITKSILGLKDTEVVPPKLMDLLRLSKLRGNVRSIQQVVRRYQVENIVTRV
jgi:two-component system response regulator GlrR